MSDPAMLLECPECGALPGRSCTWGTPMSRGRAETTVIVWLLRLLVAVFILSPAIVTSLILPSHVVVRPANSPQTLYVCGLARC